MLKKVYMIKPDTFDPENIKKSLNRGFGTNDLFPFLQNGEIVPVKLTLGDTKCVHHVSPEFVKVIIDNLKTKKTKPFIFDTNVIYKGGRMNAVDHMTLAQNKGFGFTKVGVPFIVADGLFGQDGKEYTTGGDFIKKVKIPSFVEISDSLVTVSHITGHILSGFAGSVKNIAMGMSCRPTKQVQHSSVKPVVTVSACTLCGSCVKLCPVNAIRLEADAAVIDHTTCVGCGECLCACKFAAINVNWHEDPLVFTKRMVEVAKTALSFFKNKVFINFAVNMTKECDCISNKDEKIIFPDIGILISDDPVSVDKAVLDIMLAETDIFEKEGLNPAYDEMFTYAEKIGLGSTKYELVCL